MTDLRHSAHADNFNIRDVTLSEAEVSDVLF